LRAADCVLLAAFERHEQVGVAAESEARAEGHFMVIAVAFVVRSA
jgi:hypothetical protein